MNRLFLTLILFFTSCILLVGETITMAFSYKPEENPQYLFYESIYREAFKELGYDFDYRVYPSKRATLMVNSGEVDGEPQRIFQYGERNPNLVRVEEPIFINRTLVYSLISSLNISIFSDSTIKNYKVDYIRGSVWSKEYLESITTRDKISTVTEASKGFSRLILGHSDFFIALEASSIEEYKNKYSNKLVIIGVAGSNNSYPYLHKSHREIALKLAIVLKSMKEDGRYKRILKESMPYLVE